MIKRYERCIGFSLPAIGRWKIEFWYAPPGYSIAPHTHSNVDMEVMTIIGHGTDFYRKRGEEVLNYVLKWYDIGRRFTVRAEDIHSFSVARCPLIYMNIERWKVTPTSVADNLQLTKQ